MQCDWCSHAPFPVPRQPKHKSAKFRFLELKRECTSVETDHLDIMSSSAAGKEGTSLLTVKPARKSDDTETHIETPLAAAEPTASGLAVTAGVVAIANSSDATATLANAGQTVGGKDERPPAANVASIEEKLEEDNDEEEGADADGDPGGGAADDEGKATTMPGGLHHLTRHVRLPALIAFAPRVRYPATPNTQFCCAVAARGGARQRCRAAALWRRLGQGSRADDQGHGPAPAPGGIPGGTGQWPPAANPCVFVGEGVQGGSAWCAVARHKLCASATPPRQHVYGSPTASFNNQWLRRKLGEALGLRAAPVSRGRGAPRRSGEKRQALRAAGGAGGARGRATGGATAAVRAVQERERREREEAEATAALHETADALLLASCELDTPWVQPLAASSSGVQAPASSERQQQAQQVQETEDAPQPQQEEQQEKQEQRLRLPQQQQQQQQQERSQGGTGAMPSVVLVGSPAVNLPASPVDTPVRVGFAAFQSTLPVPPLLPAAPAPPVSNRVANAKPPAE